MLVIETANLGDLDDDARTSLWAVLKNEGVARRAHAGTWLPAF